MLWERWRFFLASFHHPKQTRRQQESPCLCCCYGGRRSAGFVGMLRMCVIPRSTYRGNRELPAHPPLRQKRSNKTTTVVPFQDKLTAQAPFSRRCPPQVCFAITTLSRGQTDSGGMCFFNRRALLANSWSNPLTTFPPVFLILSGFVLWNLPDAAGNASRLWSLKWSQTVLSWLPRLFFSPFGKRVAL